MAKKKTTARKKTAEPKAEPDKPEAEVDLDPNLLENQSLQLNELTELANTPLANLDHEKTLELIAQGEEHGRAWQATHPLAKSHGAARTSVYQLLRDNPHARVRLEMLKAIHKHSAIAQLIDRDFTDDDMMKMHAEVALDTRSTPAAKQKALEAMEVLRSKGNEQQNEVSFSPGMLTGLFSATGGLRRRRDPKGALSLVRLVCQVTGYNERELRDIIDARCKARDPQTLPVHRDKQLALQA